MGKGKGNETAWEHWELSHGWSRWHDSTWILANLSLDLTKPSWRTMLWRLGECVLKPVALLRKCNWLWIWIRIQEKKQNTENYKGSQSRLAKITRHKRLEKGKLGVWIEKTVTSKQGCENQIANTLSKWIQSDRLWWKKKRELEAETKMLLSISTRYYNIYIQSQST